MTRNVAARVFALIVPVASVVVVVAVAAGCPTRPDTPIEPIKVGVLNPLSGALSSLGPDWQDAAVLAQEDVNAGGGVFDGRPLELVFADSATDADVAVTAAQHLVDQGVVGLVGPATSGESGDVLTQVANDNEIPMISCCATAKELTETASPNGGFFFRTTPSDKLQGKALAFLAKNGVEGFSEFPQCKFAAFMNRGDAYGVGFKGVFLGEYQDADIAGGGVGDVIEEGDYGEDHEADQGELNAAADDLAGRILTHETQLGTNELCIVVISFDVDGATVINEMEAQFTAADTTIEHHYLVGDGANSSAFAGLVQQRGAKVIGTVPFHALNNAYDEFVKAYKARFEQTDEPIAFTSQNYDAVFIMALAITQAKSTDGKDIRNKLFSVSGSNTGSTRFEGAFFGEVANALLAGDDVDYVGPSGELTFDAFGDVVGDYVLWQADDSDGDGAFTIEERAPLLAETFNPQ